MELIPGAYVWGGGERVGGGRGFMVIRVRRMVRLRIKAGGYKNEKMEHGKKR